ncbi:MAG: hypothetical protein LBD76_06625 [Prevotellaceae bacterium]|jgi:hypothetical protein|nr:hypothetical protein [Prevotellaceae bacterium]
MTTKRNDTLYQFTEREFNTVFPMMLKAIDKKLASIDKKIEYYQGIKDAGLATNKQNDKLLDYEETHDFLLSLKKRI